MSWVLSLGYIPGLGPGLKRCRNSLLSWAMCADYSAPGAMVGFVNGALGVVHPGVPPHRP